MARPKDQGGIEIQDLVVKNRALLGKCLYKLLIEHGVWQAVLNRKYVDSHALS
jgi:hypothetical protein